MTFYNKNGTLTRYALACGYVERKGKFTLTRDGSVYHVKGFGNNGKRIWQVFELLQNARKCLKYVSKHGQLSGNSG